MSQGITENLYFKGIIKFTTGATIYGHGHCIIGFGITNIESKEEIIPIIPFFHLEKIEVVGEGLKITFRIYPGGDEYHEIEIEPFIKRFKYKGNFYSIDQYFKTITGCEYE